MGRHGKIIITVEHTYKGHFCGAMAPLAVPFRAKTNTTELVFYAKAWLMNNAYMPVHK